MYDLGSERAGRGGAKQRRRLSYEAVIRCSYERAGGGKMPPMYDVGCTIRNNAQQSCGEQIDSADGGLPCESARLSCQSARRMV